MISYRTFLASEGETLQDVVLDVWLLRDQSGREFCIVETAIWYWLSRGCELVEKVSEEWVLA